MQEETAKYPLQPQLREVMAVIADFSNLLIKETAALKKADFKTVDTLQAGKKLFAGQYNAKVKALSGRKCEFPGLDRALRENLLKERDRFSVILDDNLRALELAQNSVKRLINRILDAARHAVMKERQTNYSNTGKALSYKSASTSLSTDQTM